MRSLMKLYVFRLRHSVSSLVEIIISASIGLIYGVIVGIVAINTKGTLVKGDYIAKMLVGGDILSLNLQYPVITLIIAIFLTTFLSQDFRNGTFRNMIVRGKSRGEIFASYYLCTIAWSHIIYLLYFAAFSLGMLVGLGNYSAANLNVMNFLTSLGLNQVLHLFYITFIFFLIFALKAGGFSIPCFILVSMGLYIVSIILIAVPQMNRGMSSSNQEMLYLVNTFLPYGQGQIIGSMNFSLLYGAPSAGSSVIYTPTRDFSSINLTVIAGLPLITSVGLYFLGRHIFIKRDMK